MERMKIKLYKPGYYYCDRFRQLDWLTEHGFRPVDTKVSDDIKNVWIFEVSKELVDCLNSYILNLAIGKTVDYEYVEL